MLHNQPAVIPGSGALPTPSVAVAGALDDVFTDASNQRKGDHDNDDDDGKDDWKKINKTK